MSARDVKDVLARAFLDSVSLPNMPTEKGRPNAEWLLSALRAAGYVIERDWQPIATAPRDGTDILARGLGMNVCVVVSWDDRSAAFPWTTLDGPSYGPKAFHRWRPLPAPPAGEATDDGR